MQMYLVLSRSRIVGGTNAQQGQFPYQVSNISQCGNFMIFLSVRFYVKCVKLNLGNLEVQNMPFLQI